MPSAWLSPSQTTFGIEIGLRSPLRIALLLCYAGGFERAGHGFVTTDFASSCRAMSDLKFVPPMLATLVRKLPDGPQWEYELKLDGYRLQAVKHGDKARLCSRRGNDFTRRFAPHCQRRFENPGALRRFGWRRKHLNTTLCMCARRWRTVRDSVSERW